MCKSLKCHLGATFVIGDNEFGIEGGKTTKLLEQHRNLDPQASAMTRAAKTDPMGAYPDRCASKVKVGGGQHYLADP